MPKRGDKKARTPAGDLRDTKGLAFLLEAFLEHSRVKGYREGSIKNRDRYCSFFIRWAQERGILQAVEVTRPILERYQRHLYHYRRENGEALSFRTQYHHLSPLRMFFKWLARERHILHNPASELELPKLDARLPRTVLTAQEMEAVLALPDLRTWVGVRDRAMLELLYSTGMRRMELIRLEVWDFDRERQTVLLRNTKGRKDRLIPVGSRACQWMKKYLLDVRPQLVMDDSERALFLTAGGQTLVADHLSKLVRDYVNAAELGKKGSCHMLRHTMATLMLDGGADIRHIQAMLGHAELSTTQIYTQVSVKKLQEVHERTHPAETRAAKGQRSEQEEELLAALDEEASEEAED